MYLLCKNASDETDSSEAFLIFCSVRLGDFIQVQNQELG